MAREPKIAERRGSGPSRLPAAVRLSAAADRLFYAHGIRAVGVEEIVAQAGVTKPSLYRSFASKDDLVVACLRARFDGIMHGIDALEAELGADPAILVRAMIETAARELADPAFRGCPITNAATEFPDDGHPVRALVIELKARLRARLCAIVARLTSTPEPLADTLILLLEGARAMRHTAPADTAAHALVRAADAVIAYAPAPAPAPMVSDRSVSRAADGAA